MNTTNTASITTVTAPDQFEFHRNPTPGFPCDICGCPGKVRARHRALTAGELRSAGKGVLWVKSVSVCFGTMRENAPVKG